MARGYFKQLAISLDQSFNALTGGWADETFSARTYRNARDGNTAWEKTERVLDFVLGAKHCQESYESEVLRKQLPKEYSNE